MTDCSCAAVVKEPFFTDLELQQVRSVLVEKGVLPGTIRYSFDRRIDLENLPWQLYGIGTVGENQ